MNLPLRITASVFLLLVLVGFIACKKDDDSPPPTQGNVTATYFIQVTDINGIALSGALVTIGKESATTNIDGVCQLSSTIFPSGRTAITVSKTGYFIYSGIVNISAGNQSLHIQLSTAVTAGNFSSTAGGTITIPNGGSVVFPANAFADANGAAYNGTVNVAATYIEPTSSSARVLLPNSFLGKNSSGTEKFLENHGTILVELSGSNGQALQIAQGSTATINIPVAAHDQGSAPASMPLYYFNTTTGLWMEEGTATLNGNFYTGTVSHFTFWMCPAIYNHYALSGTLECQSTPLPGLQVDVYNQWGAYLGSATTSASGYFGGMIPDQLTFDLVVKDPCNSVAYNQTIGPFSANTTLAPINVCSGNSTYSTITGTLLDCNGNAGTGSYCRIQSAGFMQFLPANNQGQVNASVLFCNGSTTASVSGINLANGQIAPEQNFAITPTINFGTQTVCGTAGEFAQFRLDGTDYYFTENNFANFGATYNAGQNRISVAVTGGQNMNETQFSIIIPASVPGIYSIGGSPFHYSFMLSGNNGTVNLNTTITQAGTALGNIVSGSVQDITFADAGGNNRVLQNCFFRFEIDLVQ